MVLSNVKKACVCWLMVAAAVLASSSGADAGGRRPPRPRPPLKNQDRLLKLSSSSSGLGITYASTGQGFKVTGFTGDGPVPFADGSTLDVGDIIILVGNKRCNPGADLDALIALANNIGNTLVRVRDVNSGQVFDLDLP